MKHGGIDISEVHTYYWRHQDSNSSGTRTITEQEIMNYHHERRSIEDCVRMWNLSGMACGYEYSLTPYPDQQ